MSRAEQAAQHKTQYKLIKKPCEKQKQDPIVMEKTTKNVYQKSLIKIMEIKDKEISNE